MYMISDQRRIQKMKSAGRYSILFLAVISALVGSFFLGQQYGREQVLGQTADNHDQFLKGQALEQGISSISCRIGLSASCGIRYLTFISSQLI